MKAMAPDRNNRYTTADEMLADLEAFRKDPNISFDYSITDIRPAAGGADEPTQYIPNAAVARNRQQQRYAPVDEEEEEEERTGGSWWKILLVVALVAVLGYFGVNKLYQGIMSSFTTPEIPEQTVPAVVGMTLEEAKELPEVVDGIFEIVDGGKPEYNSKYEAGEIIRQTPEAERTKRASEGDLIPITVTLSLGAKSGAMPNLVGYEGRSAELVLKQNKDLSDLNLLVVEGASEYHDTVEEGCVIRTDPAEGTELTEGDTVTLFLSLGKEIKNSTMVPCVGQQMADVQKAMNTLKLVAEFTKVEGAAPEGQVLSQSVDVGESVPEGTVVNFTYSDGQKELSKTVTFSVPYSPETVHVEMYLEGELVYSEDVSGDQGLLEQTLVAKAGDYGLKIYADSQLWVDEVISFRE